ncbi:hypothetical protein MMC39_00285 [Anabaena sp. CCAP 1446/1C]|uniref:Uncharacterized protein n=1 Tax=Anabaena cylindrica (strain ATCC 27899 / PCC 7122) TaxID=272123 RepID=K9ZAE0_ANACC|nr:hypothetical protein Anacy_0551 [Anabaena cylindrica PCC 7122]MCM2404460.1 hypothetical protein [Anabaena sp. CCAP 1446/1C]BAY01423.1 hypothetical protein NIES19_06550 [Anabaena cylindrica PCC 7122]
MIKLIVPTAMAMPLAGIASLADLKKITLLNSLVKTFQGKNKRIYLFNEFCVIICSNFSKKQDKKTFYTKKC